MPLALRLGATAPAMHELPAAYLPLTRLCVAAVHLPGGAARRLLVRRWLRPPPRATLARDSPRSETDPRRLDPLSAHPRGGRPAGHSRLSAARPRSRDPPGRDLPRPHRL